MPARAAGRMLPRRGEAGFTLVELLVTVSVLTLGIFATMQVFLTSLKTASYADARTRASAIATREAEGMRAPVYDNVGFSASQPGYVASITEKGTVYDTVVVANPASTPIGPTDSIGGITFTTRRDIVWQPYGTTSHAFKRVIATVTWTDSAGSHSVRQDAGIYPGGLTVAGSTTTTSTTAAPVTPGQPTGLTATADAVNPTTQIDLAWTAGTPAPSVWEVSYSLDSGSTWIPLTVSQPGGTTSYYASGLSSGTSYTFRVRGDIGTQSSSWVQVTASTTSPPPGCVIQSATVSPSSVKKKSNGNLYTDLAVTVHSTGGCTGLLVDYPDNTNIANRAMTVSGSVWKDTLSKTATTWSTGSKTIRIVNSSNTQLATIALTVTN